MATDVSARWSEVKVRCDDEEVRLLVCEGVSTSQKWEELKQLFSLQWDQDDTWWWDDLRRHTWNMQVRAAASSTDALVMICFIQVTLFARMLFTSVFSSHSCFEHRNTSSIRVNKPPNMHRDWDKLHNSPSWRPKAIVPTVSDLSRMPSVTLIFRSVYSVCSVQCLHWSMTVRGSGVQSDGWHQISVVLDQIKSASRSDVNWKHPIDFNLVCGRARHSWRSSFIFSIDVYDGCST